MENQKIRVKPLSHCLLYNTIVNTLISLFLVGTFIYAWFNVDEEWKFFFYLTLMTLVSNTFYVVSCTVIDWLVYLNIVYLGCYENFIRNHCWKYCFSFALAVVILYWELCLLGYDFQPLGPDVIDYTTSFYLHGMGCIFLCYDTFSTKHIDKTEPIFDFFIMTALYIFYALLLVIAKYLIKFDVYPFMMLVNNRQMTAVASLIYLICLLCYVGSYIIAKIFFEKDKGEIEEIEKIPREVWMERKDIRSQQFSNIC